jgi:hypothetical protein
LHFLNQSSVRLLHNVEHIACPDCTCGLASSLRAGFGQTVAAAKAQEDGMDWLLHIDPDEIVLPVTGPLSLAFALGRQPGHVSAVRFLNVEGQSEAGGIVNRFEQITLFRTHQVYTPNVHQ